MRIWYDDMMIWWYDDTMIWWYDDMMWWYATLIWYMMIWWYDMLIWWYDDMSIWYDDMMIWWYDDTMIWWYDDNALCIYMWCQCTLISSALSGTPCHYRYIPESAYQAMEVVRVPFRDGWEGVSPRGGEFKNSYERARDLCSQVPMIFCSFLWFSL